MSVEQRVLTCRVLEKMKKQKEYSKKIGLSDASAMHGKQVNDSIANTIGKGG